MHKSAYCASKAKDVQKFALKNVRENFASFAQKMVISRKP